MKLFYSICLCLFLFSCGTPNDSIEDVRVNEVEVTLNGGGFDNATYKLGSSPNTRLNGARYLPSYGTTNCIVTEEVVGYIDENLVSFSFDGNDKGDYSFVEPTTNSFRLLLSISEDSVLDFSPVRDETGGFLRVTRYPDVGEQIEGSFSLEGIDVRTYDVNKKIKVNGTFKIMRGSDVDNYN